MATIEKQKQTIKRGLIYNINFLITRWIFMTYLDVMKGWLCMTYRYGGDSTMNIHEYKISLNDEYSWYTDVTAWLSPNCN